MRAIVDTIHQIDESSKKILFKHFDGNVNMLTSKAPRLIDDLTKIANETSKYKERKEIDSDEEEKLQSEDSGNSSDSNDAIN